MSFDEQLDQALDQSGEQPTADAETTQTDDGTAPAPSAAQQPQEQQPQPRNERTYTQAEMDRAAAWYRKSLREERERMERELRQQYQPQPQSRTAAPADPARAQLEQLIEAQIAAQTAPLRQQMTETALDRAIGDLGRQYPEFTNDKTLQDILGIVVEHGLDRATHLSIPEVLELAHAYWLRGQPKPDIEAIKRQAADEAIKSYATRKTDTASRTPRAPSPGGAGAVGTKKIRTRQEFEDALEAGLSRAET